MASGGDLTLLDPTVGGAVPLFSKIQIFFDHEKADICNCYALKFFFLNQKLSKLFHGSSSTAGGAIMFSALEAHAAAVKQLKCPQLGRRPNNSVCNIMAY